LAPLEGLKVFDLTSVVMGPYCTLLLSYLGADVIKLESLGGDITRSIGPVKHTGQSGLFIHANNGKRSIAIDLRDPRGREICLDIARTSDVFVHSIRPDALQRLGLEYPVIAAANPRIIGCNLLGFGRKGRYFGKPAYDDTIQAASGLAMLQAEQHGAPAYVPSVFGDKLTGMMAAYAIVAAVIGRGRTGTGQEIDVPMFETMAACLLLEHASGATFKPPLGRPLYPRLVSRERRPVATKNGYLSIMVYTDKQWQGFCTVAGRTELLSDPRFTTIANRTHHTDDYYALVSEIAATRSAEEWESLLAQVEVPCMRLNRLDDLSSDPHLQDVGFFGEVTDQWGELLQLPRFPVELKGTPALEPTAAPMLGEHSREILRETGYTDSRIEALISSGVVGVSEAPKEKAHT
jgi:crotonobetainyl-CoA:carnitine CoA-transferase CaiB-like acyl-CoA transferase